MHQCALSYAMFLYCVEHTFEGVYRVPKAEFSRTAAGLLGSSYLPMPWWWQWAACGVEYHHFHHLNARVPCYRMKVRVDRRVGWSGFPVDQRRRTDACTAAEGVVVGKLQQVSGQGLTKWCTSAGICVAIGQTGSRDGQGALLFLRRVKLA